MALSCASPVSAPPVAKGYDEVATHEYKEEIKVGYNLRRKAVLLIIWAA